MLLQLVDALPADRGTGVRPIGHDSTRQHPLPGQVHGALQDRDLQGAKHQRHTARSGELAGVAHQAISGHVRHSMNIRSGKRIDDSAIELEHRRDGRVQHFR